MEFQKDELNEILNIFQQESAEIISSVDKKLLLLANEPGNSQASMELFRDIHSLKGSAKMLGFNDMQNIFHKIEDVIGFAKENKLKMTASIADFISECLEYVTELINKTVEKKDEFIGDKTRYYIEKLIEIAQLNKQEFPKYDETSELTPEKKEFLKCFDKLEETVIEILFIITSARNEKNFEHVADIAKKIRDFLPLIQGNSSDIFNSIKEFLSEILNNVYDFETNKNKEFVFIEINNSINFLIETIKNYTIRQKIDSKDYYNIVDEKINSKIIEQKLILPDEKNALKQNNSMTNTLNNQQKILNSIANTRIKTLRINSNKLDNLVGEIGELIASKVKANKQLFLTKTINNHLTEWQKSFAKMGYYVKYFDKKYLSGGNTQNLDEHRRISAYNRQLIVLVEQHNNELNNIIKEMANLYKQLQESETKLNATTREIESMVKNMRVLPLSTIFQLFPRMVHNIAKEKNKQVELVIKNKDITADKTIIEELKIPLMHIIRNAVDHGIEDVETRKALGKDPMGRIEILASYKDNNITISIKDDGRGLDIEKIKQKVLEKKILTTDEINMIDDSELTNLIFYPGFSTEDFVTEISGRGLGLDIVNNKISDLQGRISVYSELNRGTIVTITLPSVIATKKAFIIQENNQLWAIETSVIKTILRIDTDDIYKNGNNNYCIYNGEAISVYTLCQILNFENKPRNTYKHTLLIIETDNTIFGIIVEKLISDQEIVHKKIAPPLYKIKNISGVTTLANGEACLIINISDVISTISAKKIKTTIITNDEVSKIKNNAKYNILIVDDSYTTRILQQNILSRHGYNIQSSTNPIYALEKLEKEQFDLIVTDVQMPDMNGFEFIKKARMNPKYKDTPIIVMSSEPIEKHFNDIRETRTVKYIAKNFFKQDEFVRCIENILQ